MRKTCKTLHRRCILYFFSKKPDGPLRYTLSCNDWRSGDWYCLAAYKKTLKISHINTTSMRKQPLMKKTKNAAWLMLAVFATVFLSPSRSSAQSGCNCSNFSLVNPDFELPGVAPNSLLFFNPGTGPGQIPGWLTTDANNFIEVWGSGAGGVPSFSGGNFAELNATSASILYQNVNTCPGQVYNWQVAHRGRAGTDQAVLQVGPPGGPYTTIATMTDGTASWGFYSGSYTIPAGQGVTELRLVAVFAAGGISVGNFVDGFLFTPVFCTVDNDFDSYTEVQGDCNDADNTIYPNAPELCDGKDNDCDLQIDETYVATASAGGPTTFCSGGSVSLTANSGTSYQWKLNGNNISGATSQTFNATQSGGYTVTVTGGGNCIATSSPVTVTVNTIPATTIAAVGPTTFCASGSAILAALSTPFAGNALQFDGSNDFGTFARPVQSDFTIEMWVKTTQTGGAGPKWYFGYGLIDGENTGGPDDYGTALNDGKFAFGVGTGSFDYTIKSTTNINDGIWHHVAATREQGSGIIRLFVDGVEEASQTTASHQALATTATLHMGHLQTGGNFFNGMIDEVRIWNVARSSAQIQGSMYSSVANNAANLVSYFKLNEGSGGTGSNATGGGNLVVNGASWTASTAPVDVNFAWSPSTGLSSTTKHFVKATVSSTTPYTVQTTGAGGCSSTSAPATVTINAAPAVFDVTGGGGFCTGGAGVAVGLSGSQSSVNYQLKNGAANVGSAVAGTGSAISFGNQIASGNYTVVATNASTGCTANMNGTKTITAHPLPAKPTITANGPTSFCQGGSVSLVTGADVGGNTAFLNSDNATGPAVACDCPPGQVVVGYTGRTGTWMDRFQLLCQPYNAGTISGGLTGTCFNGQSLGGSQRPNFTLGGNQAMVGAKIDLYNPFGTTHISGITGYGQTAAYINGNGNNSTGYSTLGAMSGAVSSTAGTVFVPAGNVITGMFVYNSFYGGGVSFRYKPLNALNSPANNATWSNSQTGPAITVNTSGTYTVTITDGNGCTATSDPLNVDVVPFPTVYNVTGGGEYCADGAGVSVGLSDSDPGINYQLKRGTTDVGSPVAGTGNVISFGNQTVAGTYTVVAATATLNCTSNMSGSATVVVNPNPAVLTLEGGGAFCAGGTGMPVYIHNSEAGIYYPLIRNGNNFYGGFGSNGVLWYGDQPAGTYTSIAINQNTGCTSPVNGSVVITENPLPAVFNVTGGGEYCAGGNGVLIGLSGSETGVNYQLKNGSTNVGSPVAGTGNSISFGNQPAAGNYTVMAINAATNCSAAMNSSATVVVNPNPAVLTLLGGGSYCTGTAGVGVFINNSEAGIFYPLYRNGNQFYGGFGSNGLLYYGDQPAGVYTALAINQNTGCTSVVNGTVTVIENPVPTTPTITVAGSTAICPGDSVMLMTQGDGTTPFLTTDNASGTPVSCDCPPGYVAVGYTGRVGTWTDKFQLLCRQYSGGNLVGPIVGTCFNGSSNGGSQRPNFNFASNTALVGVKIDLFAPFGTTHVSGITGYGQSLSHITDYGDNTTGFSTLGTMAGAVSSTAGTVFTPPGTVITGMTIYNGSFFAESVAFRYKSLNDLAGSNTVAWSNGSTSASTFVNAPGNYTVKVTNAFGCQATSAPVTITQNVAPAFTACPANISADNTADECNAGIFFDNLVAASGTPAPTYSYSYSGATTGNGNGKGSGNFNVGVTNVTITATNSCSSATCSFSVTINDTQAPTVNCPANTTVSCDASSAPSATGTATAADNCSIASISHTDASTQNANPTNAGHYNYSIVRTWRAEDEHGNFSTCVQTVNVQDVTAPSISVPANATVNCQDATTPAALGTATGSDNCSGAAISYTDNSTQNANPANAGHYNYSITRTWKSMDVTGNFTTGVQTITVQDVTAPSISVPANVTLNCQDDNTPANTGSATGSDNCSAVAISYTDNNTQDANPANAGHYNYSITRTWKSMDVTGNFTTGVQVITIQDVTAPSLNVPASVTVNCQDDKTPETRGTATGSDNCSGVAISYTDNSTQNTSVNSPAHYNYTITRTWKSEDVSGNYTTGVQTITVQDVTAPSVTCPANATVSCKTSVADNGSATGSDNCSPVAISHSDNSTQDANPANAGHYSYTITRTWTATDVSGNNSSCAQVITVNALNNAAIAVNPVNTINANHPNHTIYIGYGPQSVTLTASTLGGVGTLSYSWAPTTGVANPNSASTSVAPTTTTTYTVTITDGTGCSITKSVTINVVDVRCGNNNNKVKLCHYPPGNNGNPQNLCIASSAVAAHLAHGCKLGDCPQSKDGSYEEENDHMSGLVVNEVKVYPNPNNGSFIIELPTGMEQANIAVLDMAGKVIVKQTANGSKVQVDLGSVARGMYMVNVTNGSEIFRTKVSVQ
jgi:hypothetical protein